MSKHWLRVGAFLAPALLFLRVASAADLPQYTFDELTDSAEVIATGNIARTWTAWDADHSHIWTHYELTVSDVEKGKAGATIDIAEPGGTLDGMRMSIAGATGYGVGEHVLVFLSRMPNGYRQLITERGRSLSAGQRQLLCLARALIVDPSIMILDEATSNLDLASERKVNQAMRIAAQGRTTLVVTHRPQSLHWVERVLVVSDGTIVGDQQPADYLATL